MSEMPPTDEEIPGVTRRHRISDLYHERTNFQFIKHTKRWAILSGTFMVLAIVLLTVRGLNFSIEFKGGTEWQVKVANGKHASITEVRDVSVVEVNENRDIAITLLFDHDSNLEERVLKEQFAS